MNKTRLVLAATALGALAACNPLTTPPPPPSSSAPSCPTVTPRINGAAHTGDVLLDCNGAQVSVQSFLYVQDPGDSYAKIGAARRFDGASPVNPAAVTPMGYGCQPSYLRGTSTMWVRTEVTYAGPPAPSGFDIIRESPHVSGGTCL